MFIPKESASFRVIKEEKWFIFSEIVIGDSVCVVGCIYFSPSANMSEAFYSLQETLDLVCCESGEKMIIVGGDFNAWVGELNSWPDEALNESKLFPERCSRHKEVNERGRLLIEMMESYNLVLLNGRLKDDFPGSFTYVSATGASVVDLVWVSFPDIHLINSFSIINEVSLSDHFPVRVSFVTSMCPKANKVIPTSKMLKLKWAPEMVNQYLVAMSTSPNLGMDFANTSIDFINENLTSTIRNCALSLGMGKMSISPAPVRKKKANWFDKECHDSQQNVNDLYKLLVCSNFEATLRVQYTECRKKYCNLVKAKKKEYYDDITLRFSQIKDSTNFWKTVKYCRGFSPPIFMVTLDEWFSFYERVFPIQLPKESLKFVGVFDPSFDSPITAEEVIKQIRKSKTGKAPGEDQISNEFYQNLPGNWILYLTVFFKQDFRF